MEVSGGIGSNGRPALPLRDEHFLNRRTWPLWPNCSRSRRTTGCCAAWRRVFRRRRQPDGRPGGILLDTETTGLDHAKDEIIELGMVKFDYTPDGRIVGVRDTFSAFNEPSVPIPPEVTALTGITDEMVAGHKIDEAAVNAFADDA